MSLYEIKFKKKLKSIRWKFICLYSYKNGLEMFEKNRYNDYSSKSAVSCKRFWMQDSWHFLLQ